MIEIRPVSDLRNNYPEIERMVITKQHPVYLTKNGHGAMVVMSLEQYAALTEDLEMKLDEADAEAAAVATRYTADEVFARVRGRLRAR